MVTYLRRVARRALLSLPVIMAKPSPWDLDFAESRKAAQKHLGAKLEVLRPLIQFLHGVLRDCRNVSFSEIDIAVATSTRQCLEFADAVDLLLRHLMIVPAAVQARSALECAAQAVYLAQQKDPVLAHAYIMDSMRAMYHEALRKVSAPGFDDADREEIRARAEETLEILKRNVTTRSEKDVVEALLALSPGQPWYSIRNGPRNVHQLLKLINAEGLSHSYADLNPVVHGGMPLLSLQLSSGKPEDADSTEWLRPLRGPSPWDFRPVLATGVALQIVLFHVLMYFTPRLPELMSRAEEFVPGHKRRCEKAGMPVLAL